MLTVLLVILLVLLLGGGVYGRRTYGPKALIGALLLALLVLVVIWEVRDERAIGPGVPPIMQNP